jgi:hypothetical protein
MYINESEVLEVNIKENSVFDLVIFVSSNFYKN